MKHLKKYQIFESTLQIEQICKEHGIQNYTINPDFVVDVDGDIDLSDRGLNKIPLKFGKVSGYFYCNNNKLTTLEGCPTSVGGSFLCDNNQLTTLEGCPSSVVGDFFCHSNKLMSLNGLTDVSIGGSFYYQSNNPIYSITSNWLVNYKRPDMDLIELFNDVEPIIGDKLYLSKLEYFHEKIGKPLPNLEEVKKYYNIIE